MIENCAIATMDTLAHDATAHGPGGDPVAALAFGPAGREARAAAARLAGSP